MPPFYRIRRHRASPLPDPPPPRRSRAATPPYRRFHHRCTSPTTSSAATWVKGGRHRPSRTSPALPRCPSPPPLSGERRWERRKLSLSHLPTTRAYCREGGEGIWGGERERESARRGGSGVGVMGERWVENKRERVSSVSIFVNGWVKCLVCENILIFSCGYFKQSVWKNWFLHTDILRSHKGKLGSIFAYADNYGPSVTYWDAHPKKIIFYSDICVLQQIPNNIIIDMN